MRSIPNTTYLWWNINEKFDEVRVELILRKYITDITAWEATPTS
jgi:hypothetical protein